MAERLLHRGMLRWKAAAASHMGGNFLDSICAQKCYNSLSPATSSRNCEEANNSCQTPPNWLMLPAFSAATDACSIGKSLCGQSSMANMTALKWVLKCCPQLPRCLVQKLFRLRRVRKKCSDFTEEMQPKRVGATDLMRVGDCIFLPKSVDGGESPPITSNKYSFFDEDESRFARSLELYKDSAIIFVNKPPGLPVQGGLGIKRSLDELAAKYLRYGSEDYPRLVHRLDRDSSGILVIGRTQLSATILHYIFREKTIGASHNIRGVKRILEKKYWALVLGYPRRPKGLISVPLVKVVLDNGKSERITVSDKSHSSTAQHAVTEYRVVDSSSHGYTWLELSPRTGRKHQLRVHCAEVLGTPIVGDYKYGWQAHKKIGHQLMDNVQQHVEDDDADGYTERGSICDDEFLLHLHCKKMVLPDISAVLKNGVADDDDVTDMAIQQMPSIEVTAPLPPHMKRSWDFLSR